MQVELLFSRNGVLVLNKPADMISEGPCTSSKPELWELLQTKHQGGNLVHRIDRHTSGLNMAGTTRVARAYMSTRWHEITRKTYLAIIPSPQWDEQVVRKLIDGKCAVTAFRVLERAADLALVECRLVQNGRTHQIRRHLKSIGSPIVGDRKYGGRPTTARAGQLLHAWRLEVRLPAEGTNQPAEEWTTVQAPIPTDFRQFGGFDWNRWDTGRNQVLEIWPVPTDWKRTKKEKKS